MENINAIVDEITRGRVSLVIGLNELYRKDKEAGLFAYELCMKHIAQYFEGNSENRDIKNPAT